MLILRPDGSWTDDDELTGGAGGQYGAAPAMDAPAAQGAEAAAPPSLSLADEVAYISAIEPSGALADRSYWTDTGEAAHKWGSPAPMSAGGTITYSFSGFTATERATLQECMALWSAECNVTFSYVAAGGALVLERGTDEDANTSVDYAQASPSAIGTITDGTLSIDPSAYGFDLSGSFTSVDGYGLSTAVHELGHALGLGHAGDYDGAVDPATQQYSAYDSRLWSVMSYVDPSDTSAEHSQYPVTGTNWDGAQVSTTPMMLDIAAVQGLYGAPSSGPLSGGQVFGFHTNIAASIANFFNFNVATDPVITLWDGGGGNTLDLSGYSASNTVDLNPGTFSSVNGLVNDIGIAFGTFIDTAIGGSGDDTFVVNAQSDAIHGGGGTDTVVFSGARDAYALSRQGDVVTATDAGVTDILYDIAALRFSDASVATSSLSCFVHGTRIAVPGGAPVPVESLSTGDEVLTADGRARRLKWIGRRSYAARFVRANRRVHPVLIRAGALAAVLGQALPRRDLRVSQEHALLIGAVLVPAGELVNGVGIVVDRPAGDLHYVHLELEDHDAVLAEGVAAETFVPAEGRAVFANAAEYDVLYPARPAREPVLAFPRVTSGPGLDRIRRQLAAPALSA